MRNLKVAFAVVPLLVAGPAMAGDNYSAGQMWGTDGSGVAVGGALESAAAHAQGGVIAGQVNAAEDGLLFSTGSAGSISIQSIGSQTVISSTISGSDNDVEIIADQDSTNSGDVTNEGQVNTGKKATNTIE